MESQHIRSATERKLGLLRTNEARSTDTTEQRLRELASDPIRPVRVWTARNPKTPPDAVATLLQDADCSVRSIASYHLRAPAAALEILARQEAEEAQATRLPNATAKRHVVAHHPNTPPQLRDELIAAGVCPGRLCDMTAEFFMAAEISYRRRGCNPHPVPGKPISGSGRSPHTGSPPATGEVTGVVPGASTASKEDWWSVLRALDDLRLVPENILDAPYEGPNKWVSGATEETWFWRFFGYL